MTLARDRKLNEMGLGPVWKLRRDTPIAEAATAPPGRGSASTAATPATTAANAAATTAATTKSVAGSNTPGRSVAYFRPAEIDDGAVRSDAIANMDWDALKAAVTDCRACALCEGRKNTVFGSGDENAQWLIVGEAPGAEEDARGEPFVGKAGQLLDAMLAALDLRRGHNVYVANVLKCRPPENRNPEPAEVARCAPHLWRQVALIRPRVILLMGRFAVQAVLGTDASIASLRGRRHSFAGTPIVVTYHPAYLLRTPVDKALAWQDLLLARATCLEGLANAAP